MMNDPQLLEMAQIGLILIIAVLFFKSRNKPQIRHVTRETGGRHQWLSSYYNGLHSGLDAEELHSMFDAIDDAQRFDDAVQARIRQKGL